MKNTFLLPAFFCLLAFRSENLKTTLKKAWDSDTSLTTPESVLFEPKENVVYVSCINGQPQAENKNSFIAKISPEGKVIKLKLTENLNATKGLGFHNGKLFVTELANIVEIDARTGKILNRYPVAGAKFLNDIAINPANGAVYFTDSGDNKVYMLQNGKTTLLLEGKPLDNPNGAFFENGRLLIGNGDGTLYAMNLKDKKLNKISEGMGGIDGITPDGKKGYFVSQWGGKIWHITPDGKNEEILNSMTEKINSADIDYIPGKKLLLVPTFFHNTVTAYEVQ
jgi:sugar lactone lactonase YvrE